MGLEQPVFRVDDDEYYVVFLKVFVIQRKIQNKQKNNQKTYQSSILYKKQHDENVTKVW